MLFDTKAAEKAACAYIDRQAAAIRNLAQYLHAHPELGLAEDKAVACLRNFFEDYGFTVTCGFDVFPELRTAMQATKRGTVSHEAMPALSKISESPFRMAFLGEYDALPKLGHGCGHNLIAAMSAGAAIGLASVLPYPHETVFFGCPAEETVGGKVFMAEAGLFKGYDGALILHPGGRNELGGSALASHPLEVTFVGRPAHVASLTDKGINALDAAVAFYRQVQEQKHTLAEGVVVGIIFTEAGTAPNVIPERATLHLTVRAKTVDTLENIVLPAVKNWALRAAEGIGAKVLLRHYEPLYKDLRQDKVLLEIIGDVMTEFGEIPVHLPDDEADGSTDVGNVSYEIPTAHPTLQIGSALEAHTPAFACAAGSEYGLAQAVKGAKIMAVTALRYGKRLGKL